MSYLLNSKYVIDESLDVLKKWEELGFLDYVKESSKEKVANAMELAVKLLRNEYIRLNNPKTQTITFPVISRLYKIDSELNIDDRFEFTEQKMLELIYTIDDCINTHAYIVHNINNIDVEARLLKLFCEIYIQSENKNLNKKEIINEN